MWHAHEGGARDKLAADQPGRLYPGVPYDYAAVAPPGGVLFTPALVRSTPRGRHRARRLEAQARQALDNLAATLAEGGSTLSQVLKTTVRVATSERSALVRVWAVVQERFAPARPPSTLLGVAVLGYPEQLVEIDAIAAVDGAA